MWVLTTFERDNVRMFEFETKEEAIKALKEINLPGIISYTTLAA